MVSTILLLGSRVMSLNVNKLFFLSLYLIIIASPEAPEHLVLKWFLKAATEILDILYTI